MVRGLFIFFFFSSRRRHTRLTCDWSSDVCSSDLLHLPLLTLKFGIEGFDTFDKDRNQPSVVDALITLSIRQHQIGRASCRKSVDLGGRRIIKKKKKIKTKIMRDRTRYTIAHGNIR